MEPSRKDEDFEEKGSKSLFTDYDIERIAFAIEKRNHLSCRFEGITRDEMLEAVKFYKNFNKAIEESGTTIRTTLLKLGVVGLVTLLLLGLYVKFHG